MLQGLGILFPLQRRILVAIASVPDMEQFYLAGGTALAEFYLGHRRSYDLDLFTGVAELVRPVASLAQEALTAEGLTVQATRTFATFVEFEVRSVIEETKVQFAYDSPFRLAETAALAGRRLGGRVDGPGGRQAARLRSAL